MSAHLHFLSRHSIFKLFAISFVATISLWPLMIMPIVVGSYVAHLGYSDEHAGWLSSINMAGIALVTLLISFSLKRFRLRHIACCGLLLLIAADIASLFFHSPLLFAALRFIAGLGSGATAAAAAAAIARSENPEKGYSIYIGFQFLLPALAIYLLAEYASTLDYHGMIYCLISGELIALLALPAFGQQLPEQQTSSFTQKPFPKEAALSLLGLCAYGAATSAVWAYSERIGSAISLSSSQVGLILSLVTVFSISGAVLVTFLGQWFGYFKPLVAGIVIQVLGLLALYDAQSMTGYTLGLALFTFAWAYNWPLFLSIQAQLDKTGRVVVAGQFFNLVGNAAGPAIAASLLYGNHYKPVINSALILSLLSLAAMSCIYLHTNKKSVY